MQGKGHVIKNVFAGHQVEILKNHAHLALQLAQVVGVERGDLNIHNPDIAAIVRLKAVETTQKRGLSCPGMPDNTENFATAHMHVDVLQNNMAAETLAKLVYLNHALGT